MTFSESRHYEGKKFRYILSLTIFKDWATIHLSRSPIGESNWQCTQEVTVHKTHSYPLKTEAYLTFERLHSQLLTRNHLSYTCRSTMEHY